MPSVKVTSSSNLAPAECFSRVTKMFETDQDLRKLDPHFNCKFDAQGLKGTAEGKQFKATMNVLPSGAGSNVEIVVDLPLLLSPVKGMVQKTLEKKLASALS